MMLQAISLHLAPLLSVHLTMLIDLITEGVKPHPPFGPFLSCYTHESPSHQNPQRVCLVPISRYTAKGRVRVLEAAVKL